MSLTDKYLGLITQAKALTTSEVTVTEENGVLHINGLVAKGEDKTALWNTYNTIDPDFKSGELILNIKVDQGAGGTQFKVTTQSSNLNIRKGPGTDMPIIGKAAHHSVVTLLSEHNADWALVRSSEGVEGYCSRQFLTKI